MDVTLWRKECQQIFAEFQQQMTATKHRVLVIGCSTSEIAGEKIGTSGSMQVAEIVYQEAEQFAKRTGMFLAFQCCEHLNRALVVEKEIAERFNLEIVSVIPVPSAGGSMASYAYQQMKDPVVVEFIQADFGIDIGDTFIGMHLKHVAVPVRVSRNSIGDAHVTLAKTRPKLIGGERAVYHLNREEYSCF